MKYKQILLISFLLIWCSCSTLSFIPREGGAAKFNLATVDYVESQVNAQTAELLAQIIGDVEHIIDSLLVEDRARLAQFESLLAEQETQVHSLSSAMDSTYVSMNALSNKVLTDISGVKSTTDDLQLLSEQLSVRINNLSIKVFADISGVKSTTDDLQLLSEQLSVRMDALSKEALRELQKVLATYLQEPPATNQE